MEIDALDLAIMEYVEELDRAIASYPPVILYAHEANYFRALVWERNRIEEECR